MIDQSTKWLLLVKMQVSSTKNECEWYNVVRTSFEQDAIQIKIVLISRI